MGTRRRKSSGAAKRLRPKRRPTRKPRQPSTPYLSAADLDRPPPSPSPDSDRVVDLVLRARERAASAGPRLLDSPIGRYLWDRTRATPVASAAPSAPPQRRGRKPLLADRELQENLVSHPGPLSDAARARILTAALDRPISPDQVARTRNRLGIPPAPRKSPHSAK